MNERIKELRKALNLNQTIFGEKIGVKQTTIAGYENGSRQPIDAVINSICRTFNVSEKWLQDGEGEMFLPELDEEAAFVSQLLSDEENPLYDIIKAIMKTYCDLGTKEQEVLKSFAKNFKNNVKKESQD